MADLVFDAIIVGGGTKGLSTGMYLAKYGGMSVGIFEELHELGGGLAGEQIAPGVQCNTHASAHPSWYYETVIKEDFPEMWQEGFKFLPASSNNIYAFDDGTCITLYGTELDPDGTRSAAQIARFSQKDAETYLKMRELYFKYIEDAQIEEAFSVPKPHGEPGPLVKALMRPEVVKAGIDRDTMALTGIQAARKFYESIEAQYMVLRMGAFSEKNSFLEAVGGGLQALTGSYIIPRYHLLAGGSHNLAHILHQVLYKYGAKTYTHSQVQRLIIENGQAKGIQLKDGTRIDARRAIISTLSPYQLCHDLIGTDNLSSEIVRKIDNLETSFSCSIGLTFACRGKPRLKCSAFNPDIGTRDMSKGLSFINLGPKNIESIVEQSEQITAFKTPGYQAPRPQLFNMFTHPDNTQLCRDPDIFQWDVYTVAPPAWARTKEYWIKLQYEFPDWQLNALKKYVDGIDWNNVIGLLVRTPYWIARHLRNMAPSGNVNIIDVTPAQMGASRPIPELAQHRTPVKGLYATGSAFGNWGMSSFCSSYTCYKIMAEDLGLRMPWKEKGRTY